MFEAETNVSASIERYYSIRKNLCSKKSLYYVTIFYSFCQGLVVIFNFFKTYLRIIININYFKFKMLTYTMKK